MQRPTAQLPAPDYGTASHDQVSTTSTGGRESIFTPHRRSPTGEIQGYGTPTPPPGTDADPAAEPAALTVTLQAADPDALPDALAAVLAALRCHPKVVGQPQPP